MDGRCGLRNIFSKFCVWTAFVTAVDRSRF